MDQLRELIAYIFDHPVANPEWYWSEDAPKWPGTREDTLVLIAQTFERGGELLACFPDEQLNQGFWFLAGDAPQNFMHTLADPKIPLAARLRALKSLVHLFEQVMAKRCSSHLSHLDEQPANQLNSACYMWWDLLWHQLQVDDRPEEPARAQFDAEVLLTLSRLLAIPHDACRESALHGIGHWARRNPHAGKIVDEFLSGTSSLRPELIAYAERASVGNVL
jgi:hypothetical protein